jgi:hypothetical protein
METARAEATSLGRKAAYDAVTSDAGQAAVRTAATSAATNAWHGNDSNA